MEPQITIAPDRQPALRMVPVPADTNYAGDIFGGWVMSQVDMAAGITAERRSRGRVVTVAVNAFHFKQPISVGDIVSFYTEVTKVGRTSITVEVLVIAERNPSNPVTVKVTEATLTFVAVDAGGNKRELTDGVSVPPPDSQK